jgi:hypothetical protein
MRREAFQKITLMDSLIIIEVENKCQTRFECCQFPSFVKYLRKWGKAGVVKLRNATTPKIFDRGHGYYLDVALYMEEYT